MRVVTIRINHDSYAIVQRHGQWWFAETDAVGMPDSTWTQFDWIPQPYDIDFFLDIDGPYAILLAQDLEDQLKEQQ